MPLQNWLASNRNWAIQRIVGYRGDYVTLQFEEPMLHDGRHYYIEFNIHGYNTAHPTLGSIWATGIYRCDLNAQENPRARTCLDQGMDFYRRNHNPPPEVAVDLGAFFS